MNFEQKLVRLRVNVRKNAPKIISSIKENYLTRKGDKAIVKPHSICIFCGTSQNLTKEHVIPKWCFGNDQKRFFETKINKQKQSYSKTTVPVCMTCNNDLLSSVEKQVKSLLHKNHFLTHQHKSDIIRWLEIIEYKFQVLDTIRRFLKTRDEDEIPYLRDFPLTMFRGDETLSLKQVVSELRWSLNKIAVRDKSNLLNSLVVYNSSNAKFHFFHKFNHFIFLELPQSRKGFMFFFNVLFESELAALRLGDEVISTHY